MGQGNRLAENLAPSLSAEAACTPSRCLLPEDGLFLTLCALCTWAACWLELLASLKEWTSFYCRRNISGGKDLQIHPPERLRKTI